MHICVCLRRVDGSGKSLEISSMNILYIFQHSSNISTLQSRFDQMLRRGVSTKGGKKAAAPAGAAADIHFTWRPWDQTAVML